MNFTDFLTSYQSMLSSEEIWRDGEAGVSYLLGTTFSTKQNLPLHIPKFADNVDETDLADVEVCNSIKNGIWADSCDAQMASFQVSSIILLFS